MKTSKTQIEEDMKKTVNVAIGGRSFILDEDAYNALSSYLDSFKAGVGQNGRSEVMDELEMRIADLFKEKLMGREVVDISIVRSVIAQLGMPDWQAENVSGSYSEPGTDSDPKATRRLYRDLDHKMIGGVCSGLSLYLNIDVVVIRILFVIALIFGTAGFWIYIVLCIIAPAARTAAEKCEMRGIPATAENIRKFSETRRR